MVGSMNASPNSAGWQAEYMFGVSIHAPFVFPFCKKCPQFCQSPVS
jgi:hypothetical protein